MTAETEFPKSDGDILYASEVNGFHKTNVWFAGSTDWFDSGTGVILGSTTFPAGSLSNKTIIEVYYDSEGALGGSISPIFLLSGTNAVSLVANSPYVAGYGNCFGNAVFRLGSPEYLRSIIHWTGGDATTKNKVSADVFDGTQESNLYYRINYQAAGSAHFKQIVVRTSQNI